MVSKYQQGKDHAESTQHDFIKGTDLIFQSSSTKDCHEMNSCIFRQWFTNLLRGLKESSIIIIYRENPIHKDPKMYSLVGKEKDYA